MNPEQTLDTTVRSKTPDLEERSGGMLRGEDEKRRSGIADGRAGASRREHSVREQALWRVSFCRQPRDLWALGLWRETCRESMGRCS